MREDAVAIVGGSGALGFGLALRLGRAGIPVVFGSRAAERAADAAQRAAAIVPDGDFAAAENADAAARAPIVMLSVPFASHAATVRGIASALTPGQLLVDTTVPLATAVGGKPTRVLSVWQGSVAEQAEELVPDGVRVVSALHTVSAAMLGDLDRQLDEDVLVCGDDKPAKQRVAALLARVEGLRAVDAGLLEAAQIVETLTALLIGMNRRYRTHAGIRVTGLPAELWPR